MTTKQNRVKIAKLFGKKPWSEKELSAVPPKKFLFNEQMLSVRLKTRKLSPLVKRSAEYVIAAELVKRLNNEHQA